MRLNQALVLAGLAVALLLAALWLGGGFTGLRIWAEAGARAVQRDMAVAVRAIATGQPGALTGLLAVGFAYGFFHAAGPGHGKMLIGGYGLARRVPLLRLAGLALISSLAQSTVAIGLVYALIFGLGWARGQVEGVSTALFLPLSHLAILGIGVWLLIRGIRGLRRAKPAGLLGGSRVGGAVMLGGHVHGADCGPICGCGHAHGPTLEQAAAVNSWRAGAALVAAIALRPCSGALFLLIVSWQMGIAGAGIAGVYAMGLGTALVTVLVAGLAVWSREGLRAAWPRRLARLAPLLELSVGVLLTAITLPLLLASLEAGPGLGARPGMQPAASMPVPGRMLPGETLPIKPPRSVPAESSLH
ncbi:nickel/cobalt transporter [Gemmobacter serpentinus]|uniref:nickel/cobalt transporter n=1 Tax=Gemmobacter serpentinus TaxID=2652247 RepID=UPI00124E7FDB|nr:hypothetical protein [Gemmobacter serpentinus]